MSEFLSVSDDVAQQLIAAAVAEGAHAQPEFASGAIVDALKGSLGPIVEAMVALIKSGLTNLPAILAALQASGTTLPSWVSLVANILLAIMKPATSSGFVG